MLRTVVAFAASLVFVACLSADDSAKDGRPALEAKLLGQWQGPDCGGDWTFRPDGTFEAVRYSPGNSKLAGTWSVRWDSLPPTWIRICKTSDDADYVGKTWEDKLIQLDDKTLAFQSPDQYPDGNKVQYTRMSQKNMEEK